MFLITPENLATTLVICCVAPILILMVWAIVVAIRNKSRTASRLKKEASQTPVDTEQRNAFYEAYGGEENVLNIEAKMTRLTVKVEDINNVVPEKLKELGANNVLLVGDEVKCSFGDRASYIERMMKSEPSKALPESEE